MELNRDNVMAMAHVREGSDAERMLYGLIDHGAIPDLTKRLSKLGIEWTSLFEGSRDEGALEVAPILVAICKNGEFIFPRSALDWLMDAGRYTSSLQFLASPLDMRQMTRRLAERLEGVLPDNVEVLLRYFDGRVFESLMTVLSDEQRSQFLSITSAWHFVDRAGDICSCPAHFTAEEAGAFPLIFNVEQERLLIEQSEPDQVAMLLQQVLPSHYDSMAPAERCDFLRRHIAAARSYQIDSVQAQALYCSLAITEGEYFAAQEKWHEAVMEVSAKRLTLFDAVRRFFR